VEQRSKLRRILWNQHRQIIKLRNERFDAGLDRFGLNAAILDQTKARVMAIPNKDQK
jgi:hypothetical protein